MNARRRADLVVEELAGGAETVLVDARGGVVVSLNPTAAAVWYLCDGARDAAAIAREIAQALPGADLAQVQKDVEATLSMLAGRGLLA